MMKLHVVMADTWNGEASFDRFDSLWYRKEAADRYVEDRNAERPSDYAPRYFPEDEAVEVRGAVPDDLSPAPAVAELIRFVRRIAEAHPALEKSGAAIRIDEARRLIERLDAASGIIDKTAKKESQP